MDPQPSCTERPGARLRPHMCQETHACKRGVRLCVHRGCWDTCTGRTHTHKPIRMHMRAEDPSHSPHVPQRCQRAGLSPVAPKTTFQGPTGAGG